MRSASASLLSLVALLTLAPPARSEDLNRIVLRVNEQIATLREYEERREERLQMIGSAPDLNEDERRRMTAEVGKATMKEIFDELLVLSRAQQIRVVVTREQVDRAVESSRKRFGIPTQEEFEAALVQSGMTLDMYRKRLEKQLQTQEVLGREVQPRVKVDDEVVLRYYREHPTEFMVPERIQVREFVVTETGRADPASRAALAAELRGRVAGGTPMADVVAAHPTAGEVSALVDLGWVQKGELSPALERAVWGLAAGEVSEPVEGRGGLHVLQVAAREPEHRRAFGEVRSEIEQKESDRIYLRESRRYLGELAARAFVFESLPADAVGYRTLEPPAERDLLDLPAPTEAPAAPPAPATAAEPPSAPTPAPPPSTR